MPGLLTLLAIGLGIVAAAIEWPAVLVGLVILLEHLEAFLAAHGLPHLAGVVCRLAVDAGMIGPCLPT